MRLSFALSALVALVLGGADAAWADAPPAAPIFYCPTPGKAEPAPAVPAKAAHTPQTPHAGAHRHHGCPVVQAAAQHRHGHRHVASSVTVVADKTIPRPRPANDDVSASQAFIYRYERALHGLDARAAEQAWAEGRHPPCPGHCPDHWRRDGARDVFAQNAPGPPAEQRPLPPPMERMPPPPLERAPPPPPAPPPPRAYAWQDNHSGYRYDERGEERERAGGWRYSEVDGHGRYQHWGDHFDGEPAWNDRVWNDRVWNDGDGDWRDGGRSGRQWAAPVRRADVAGRDAAGYLTWPGKTE